MISWWHGMLRLQIQRENTFRTSHKSHLTNGHICGESNQFYGLVQEIRNSSALAMELRLSCTNQSNLQIEAWKSGSRFCIWHFQMHFLNENVQIANKISLKYAPICLIYAMSALVQVIAWYRQAASHNLNSCWPPSIRHSFATHQTLYTISWQGI